VPGQIKRTRGQAAYRRAADAAGKIPINSVLPAITGTTTVGQTLTCSTGTWSRSPTFARQWMRDGVDIPGATASTYLLVSADLGKKLRCRVTATSSGVPATVMSAETATIA
jgi:hypothetical protein